jgi:hypothetical protein
MNYDEIDVEKEVQAVENAVASGAYRRASKKESMAVRLAALSAIESKMQAAVKNERQLVNA